MIWLHCEGANPDDQENMGDIRYYPFDGFPAYYFPFTNNPGYISPIVGVQLHNIKSK